jgi:hypothetical protein
MLMMVRSKSPASGCVQLLWEELLLKSGHRESQRANLDGTTVSNPFFKPIYLSST